MSEWRTDFENMPKDATLIEITDGCEIWRMAFYALEEHAPPDWWSWGSRIPNTAAEFGKVKGWRYPVLPQEAWQRRAVGGSIA